MYLFICQGIFYSGLLVENYLQSFSTIFFRINIPVLLLGLKHWRPGVLKMNFMTTILWSKVTDMNVYDTWKTCRHTGNYKRILKPSTLPYSSLSHLKCLINWFVLCYPIFRIRTRVCVCLYWRISLTTKPIWFSFSMQLL